MAGYTITLEDSGESFRCKDDESLLKGMERLGRRGIPVGCRGGGCGVCRVEVRAGEYRSRVMSRACVSAAEEAAGTVLACRVFPRSDMRLAVVGPMRKRVGAAATANRGEGRE